MKIKHKKKIYILFIFLILIFTIAFILKKEITSKIAINDNIFDEKIPLYLKINNIINNHYNYKYLVNTIKSEENNINNIILNTAKWVNENIQKLPEGVDVIDYHPLTIVQRRLGLQYQFNDILCVLLIYLDIESFFLNNTEHQLTLFKINNYWSVIDPYYGIYFINEDNKFASLEELKTNNWQIVNLESQKISSSDLSNTFSKKLSSYNDIKNYYQKIFNSMQNSEQIDEINIYERGGRSYLQKPYHRIRFEIYKFL